MNLLKHCLLLSLITSFSQAALADVYQEPDAFLQQVFTDAVPAPKVLWITGEVRQMAEQILQHRPASLRTRYWQQDKRSVWILDEIGKEKPITVGIVINDNKIEMVKVLIFRESRGWEVKHPFFTDQFEQAWLQENMELSKPIDGITGATLSARALTKLSRMALYFHRHVNQQS